MLDTDNAATGRTRAAHGFQSDVRRLGQYVAQLHDDLSGIATSVREVAHSGVAATKEAGKNTIDVAKRTSRQADRSLREEMARHPMAALGIAMGVGVLIGLVGPAIVRRARRNA